MWLLVHLLSCQWQQQMTTTTTIQLLYFNRYFYMEDNICDFLFSSCPLQQQMTMSPTKQQPLYFNRHFYKKDNICDFVFTLMSSEILSKRSYYLTDKNSLECYVPPCFVSSHYELNESISMAHFLTKSIG